MLCSDYEHFKSDILDKSRFKIFKNIIVRLSKHAKPCI